MAELAEIVEAIQSLIADGPLKGRHIIVTSGPTFEPIDPVRYIANRSSGKQGTAIAEAMLAMGARVSFITGPSTFQRPEGAHVVEVESAADMLQAVEDAGACDVAIFAAAVADWRVENAGQSKIKKVSSGQLPSFDLVENPDILQTVAKRKSGRPELVIGFAAETENVVENATIKRLRKGCDWILANDVSPETGIMGGDNNKVTLITKSGADPWALMTKSEVARKLAVLVSEALSEPNS